MVNMKVRMRCFKDIHIQDEGRSQQARVILNYVNPLVRELAF